MPAALRETGDEELRGCLEQALAETLHDSPRVVRLERRPFAYETSFAIDELRAVLGDCERLDLLVKDVGAGLSAAAAATKPARALEPRREIAVYRSLLRGSAIPAPRFYGAAEDAESGRAWLFLERVPGEVLADVGGPTAWRAAAAWAAQLGGVAAALDPAVDRLLLHRDRGWHQHWLTAAAANCESSDRTRLAARLRASAGRLLDRLDALPRAFVHGELYPSNVIVVREGTPESGQVKPVDWEMAGTGPFALDLAALATGWTGDERQALYAAFHEALPGEVAESISPGDLDEAVSLCELSLALQWLGWSADWQPPAEHRRDWAAEADRLMEELVL
ncbi:MAG: phosphotransferase family protein [Solirubrobacterales bacterium]